jgi:DNA-binding transcriptional LysR family regulator
MGRRLEALELRAGARLLTRTPGGYVLTPAGEAVLAHVERIEAETLAVERAIAGKDIRLEGSVRLTTVGTFAESVLPPILCELRETHPGIMVEIVVDTRALSLTKREADLALRFARFTQGDLAARKVGELTYGLYASHTYLARHGAPSFEAGAPGHAVVQDLDLPDLPEMEWLRACAPRAATVFTANSRGVQHAMVAAGIGVGALVRYLGDADSRLVRLDAPRPSPMREIWLGVHDDIRHTPRIRAVADALVAGLRRMHGRLAPD